MWLALSMVLAAGPRTAAGAEVVTHVPKVGAVAQVLPFFSAAGTRSVLLRPQAWRGGAHPLLDLDLTSSESLARAGLDPDAGLTRSTFGDAELTCVTLKDVAAYQAGCDAKLARLGEVFTSPQGAVTVRAAKDPLDRVLGAYAVQGKLSCALAAHGRTVGKQLELVAQALTKPASEPLHALAASLPGVATFMTSTGSQLGAVSIATRGLTATLDGRGKGLALAQLSGAGPSPLGAFAPQGLAVVRARLAKAQLPSLVELTVSRFPGSAALAPVARQLAAVLTGNVAAVASHARVTTGLRTREARFFALKSAFVLEVSDEAAAAALLAQLDPKALTFREGTLLVSQHGRLVVVANDADVKAKVLASLERAAGRQAHGLELVVEPKLVARALQQVPLLEAVQSPELAGLVAASTELGPLLLASEKVSGWLDSAPGGKHVGQLTWVLDAAVFASDAGAP